MLTGQMQREEIGGGGLCSMSKVDGNDPGEAGGGSCW